MVNGGAARRWIALLSIAALGVVAVSCAHERPTTATRAAPAGSIPLVTATTGATSGGGATTSTTRAKVTIPPKTTTTIDAVAAARTTTTPPPRGWESYRAPTGVRMNLPSSWEAGSPDGGEIDIIIDPYAPDSIRFVIGEPVIGVSAESIGQYLALEGEQFARIDALITDKGHTTFAGRDAYEWHYRATSSRGRPLELWTIVTVKDGKGWRFTYVADEATYAASEAQVREVFASIQIPD